jgi:hypothetical protein
MLGEHLRLLIHRHIDLLRFTHVVCRIALGSDKNREFWTVLVQLFYLHVITQVS